MQNLQRSKRFVIGSKCDDERLQVFFQPRWIGLRNALESAILGNIHERRGGQGPWGERGYHDHQGFTYFIFLQNIWHQKDFDFGRNWQRCLNNEMQLMAIDLWKTVWLRLFEWIRKDQRQKFKAIWCRIHWKQIGWKSWHQKNTSIP